MHWRQNTVLILFKKSCSILLSRKSVLLISVNKKVTNTSEERFLCSCNWDRTQLTKKPPKPQKKNILTLGCVLPEYSRVLILDQPSCSREHNSSLKFCNSNLDHHFFFFFTHLQIRLALTFKKNCSQIQSLFQKQNHTGGSLIQEKKQNFASLQTVVTEKCLHPVSSLHIHRIINKHNTQSSWIGATLTEYKNSTENAT